MRTNNSQNYHRTPITIQMVVLQGLKFSLHVSDSIYFLYSNLGEIDITCTTCKCRQSRIFPLVIVSKRLYVPLRHNKDQDERVIVTKNFVMCLLYFATIIKFEEKLGENWGLKNCTLIWPPRVTKSSISQALVRPWCLMLVWVRMAWTFW